MLMRANDIRHLRVVGLDGDIGPVRDVYFDDARWVVRYLVVNTGGWLGPDVLLSPVLASDIQWDRDVIRVPLSQDEVADSPSIDVHRPVSRQDEGRYYAYYGFAPYWSSTAIWPAAAGPGLFADATLASIRARRAAEQPAPSAPPASAADSHLRSTKEVTGYHIHAADRAIGHVDDFLIDEDTWAIRFLDVDTSNWIGGTSVAIARDAVGDVQWPEQVVSVALTSQQVEAGPRVAQLEARARLGAPEPS